MTTKTWYDLSPYEQCVLCNANSGDGSGPPSFMSSWNPWYEPEDLPKYSERLTAAMIALMADGLVTVKDGMTLDAPLMTIEEVRLAAANLQNWFYGDEGLDQVLWVTTTDAGDRLLLATAPGDEAMRYYDPRRHLSGPDDPSLDPS